MAFGTPENNSNLEVIDNELDSKLGLLEKNSLSLIDEKIKAYDLLDRVDGLHQDDSDIDMVYDKTTKLYYLVLGESQIIQNGDLTNENLDLVKYMPFAGTDINGMEKIINKLEEDRKMENEA